MAAKDTFRSGLTEAVPVGGWEPDNSGDKPVPIGVLTLTVTRKEHHPIYGGGSISLGEAIENLMAKFYESDPEGLLSDVTFSMEEDEARRMRAQFVKA